VDAQTRNVLRNLDRFLQSTYKTAANDAIRENRQALQRIVDYEETDYSYTQDSRQRRERIFQDVWRDEATTFYAMAAIVVAAGLVACKRIKNTNTAILERNYHLTIGSLQHQLGQDGPRWWNFLPRDELQSRIQESAFTKVSFNRLGFNSHKAKQYIMKRLQSQMMQSILANEGVDGLQARIRRLTRSSYYDARRIARTEAMRCANQGSYEAGEQAYREYGIRTRKIWVHTDTAKNPRDDHRAMNGVAAGDDGYFVLPNEERALYPLDPNLSAEQSIHCSCTFYYEVIR